MPTDATEIRFPPARRRLYLLRHGDVSYFDADGRPVRPDTVPLNDAGLRQAEAARQELAGVPFDRVLSSDLPRSRETAAIVTAGRALPIEARPELREVQPGRLADIPAGEVERAFLGAFAADITRETRFLAGEAFGSLLDRVLACLRGLLAEAGWRRLLLVAHGGVNRAILTHALGSGLAGFAALEQDPGCINVLDVDDAGRWVVRLVNHTPYNPAKQGLEMTTMERLYAEYRVRLAPGAASGRQT
jgi:broad specificity phosphatase PhoE